MSPSEKSDQNENPTKSLKVNKTGEEYDFSMQVGHLLRKAYQKHTSIFQKLSPDSQLTSMQLAALCALAQDGPSPITVLGRETAIDPATIRGIVERLKSRDLVSLSPDPQDGRKVIVTLTKSGEELVFDMLPCALDISSATLDSLNPGEQVALAFLLNKMCE